MPGPTFPNLAAALIPAPPAAELPLGAPGLVAVALACLLAAGFFAVLRSALIRSVPSRVLGPIEPGARRARLESQLLRADSLAHAASLYRLVFDLSFALLVLDLLAGDGRLTQLEMLLALGICVPLLLLSGEMLPAAFAGPRSDALLRGFLPAFRYLHWPASAIVLGLISVRRGVMRLLRVEEQPEAARRILEELRGAIEDAELAEELDEHEREIIENVMEFHDVDVGEVMTPRTEIHAVEVGEGLEAAVRAVAECGHSRIPVYEGSLDRVVGIVSARDVLQRVAEDQPVTEPTSDDSTLRDLMRPAHFVPETKLVSELLAEFRGEKLKVAVVLDEYGGTSGLVTLGDLLSELVGDFHDEWEDEGPAPIRRLPHGEAEVDAAHRVSDVNEELGLELPEEEDYETLAGFVLAQLGHFPRVRESFSHGDVEFTVLEATDRRVLRVGVKQLVREQSA